MHAWFWAGNLMSVVYFRKSSKTSWLIGSGKRVARAWRTNDDTQLKVNFVSLRLRSQLRPRAHYAGEIWKRKLISTVRPTVHTNPSRKRSFSKTLFKPVEFENTGLCLSVDRKHFENGAFRKRWHHANHMISLAEFSSSANPKWPVIVVFSNSSGVVETVNNSGVFM